MDVQFTDLLTIGLLVLLEGLLSADNALVLAILVLGLPRGPAEGVAVRHPGGIRLSRPGDPLAAYMIGVAWVKLVGAAYLLWLPFAHFREAVNEGRTTFKPARPWLGRQRSGRRSSRSS